MSYYSHWFFNLVGNEWLINRGFRTFTSILSFKLLFSSTFFIAFSFSYHLLLIISSLFSPLALFDYSTHFIILILFIRIFSRNCSSLFLMFQILISFCEPFICIMLTFIYIVKECLYSEFRTLLFLWDIFLPRFSTR